MNRASEWKCLICVSSFGALFNHNVMSRSMRNRSSGFPTRSDKHRTVQFQEMARSLKFLIRKQREVAMVYPDMICFRNNLRVLQICLKIFIRFYFKIRKMKIRWLCSYPPLRRKRCPKQRT